MKKNERRQVRGRRESPSKGYGDVAPSSENWVTAVTQFFDFSSQNHCLQQVIRTYCPHADKYYDG